MACPTNDTIAERFWKKIDKQGPIPKHCPELGPCWIWTGSANQSGYGQIGTKDGLMIVHRLHWKWNHGEIPEGKEIMHRCDNTRCVRLIHLFVGTHADNMRDMVAKGRNRQPRGTEHYKFRMRKVDAQKIRLLRAKGMPIKEIAVRFSRRPNTISKIVHGKRW